MRLISVDKTNSVELSEAINSMFAWYAQSQECFAYLSDVPTAQADHDVLSKQFANSRWFTRSWTLPELLAPTKVTFYAVDWSRIGTRRGSMVCEFARITGIDQGYLNSAESVASASLARRMSWASKRMITREEDTAYCLLGFFGISMPLLYGEGSKAFARL
ncbi:hypothetical protein CDEST_08936 [Colletotrichum destructivum]|uniref:Uncharacterized protein n=1 Tax=Colletotrichum destructivum TaxID=34406 RepID=A0AAX4IKN5_9PEZI|nr:hypothetical protein CDEST_08936 [Colletotrichum destructivum]